MVRILLVGAGGMGRAWAKNITAFADRATLCGWVDIVDGRAEQAFFDTFGFTSTEVRTYTDLASALKETSPDVVIDVTVPEAHEGVTLMALAHGAHVLGEKPLSTSLDSGSRMIRAAEEAGLTYMVSQSRRYDGGLHAFRSCINELGGVALLTADFFIGAHFGGFRDVMADVLLKDMAIHTFDAARFLIPHQPTSVSCDSFRLPWSWYEGAESALATFQFGNGARFSYRGSWASEGHSTSWESSWRAICPKGTVTWDGGNKLCKQVVVGSDGFIRECDSVDVSIPPYPLPGIAGSLNDFLNALQTGSTPMGICSDNIWSLAMVLYAVESSHTGQKVDIAI